MTSLRTENGSGSSGLAWAASPLPELVRLAWPITVSMLSYSVMTLVGTLFVGRLGSYALAGVGLGGTAAFTLMCFGFGVLRGVKVLVSQAVGAGSKDEADAFLGAGILWAAALSVAIVIAGEIVAQWLPGLAATAASGDAARTYLRIRILGTPMVLVYVAIREARYGLGDARSPMVGAVAGNVVNVALDWLLIVHLGLGVAGAAWSTVFAHLVEAGVLCAVQRRDGFGLGVARLRHALDVWRLGLPTALQFVLESGSFALLAALIASLSEVEMAAHQIALQVIHFSFLPAFAVGEAASVLTGQAVGADRGDLVRVVARRALLAAGVYTGLCSLLFAFGGAWIVAPFAAETATRVVAVRLLVVAAIFQVFDGANIIARGALRGTGDVRYAAAIGILTSWLLTPPMTWLLGVRAGLGALGGWTGLCLEIIAGALLLWWRLERGAWRHAAARSRERFTVVPAPT
ncbi:MAG: MATE family efflux transporter [Deltaproteobacteria bacterium]|nr:MATE family efflux transporter [Deltaproteobacteria bacterium]